MTLGSPSEAAKHLWACATYDSSAAKDVIAASERLCVALHAELGRWIGTDGFRALVERASIISRIEHPALGNISCLGGTEGGRMTADAVQAHGAAAVAAGMVALLSALIELLGRIIGDEMAIHLVTQIEIPSSRAIAHAGSEEDRNG
jgi:hypothetical protein